MAFTVVQLRDRLHAKPVYLVEIALLNGGDTLYLSDRNLVFSAQNYEAYLKELGELGEEIKRVDSSGLNADITFNFFNDSYKTDDYIVELFDANPIEGAPVTVKEIYIDNEGNNSSDSVTLFVGVMGEPLNINKEGFDCTASNKAYVQQWKNRR